MQGTSRNVFTGLILPALVFPVLTGLAVHSIFGHMFKSGLAEKLTTHCPKVPTTIEAFPYHIPYTSISAVDDQLCGLVAFFHAAMEPIPSPFLAYFLATGAPLMVIPSVEASRSGLYSILGFPVIVGILSQVATAGITMSLYWFLFVISGAVNIHRQIGGEHTKVRQGHAEAIAFSVVVGAIIPSLGMIFLDDPYVTAIWQVYPLWVSISGFVHHFFRPSSRHSESGYVTIKVVYIGLFIISSSAHFATVWPRLGDVSALRELFVPSLAILSPETSLEQGVLNFLQWDAVFALASTIIATFWFASNMKELLGLIVWYVVAIVTMGPGAAISGVFLFRESILEAKRAVETEAAQKRD